MSETRNSRIIKAPANTIFEALTDPAAIAVYQAPNNMKATVHQYDLRVGGGYEMSLYYPAEEQDMKGKTGENEDRFSARFVEIVPDKKLVQAIEFQSPDEAFSGTMIMEIILEPADGGTEVIFQFRDIPGGIDPKDNEAGTLSTLEKLAGYVEG